MEMENQIPVREIGTFQKKARKSLLLEKSKLDTWTRFDEIRKKDEAKFLERSKSCPAVQVGKKVTKLFTFSARACPSVVLGRI